MRKGTCELPAGDRDLKQILWCYQGSETVLNGLDRDEEMIEPVSAGHDCIADVCSSKPSLPVLGTGHRLDQLVACDIGRLAKPGPCHQFLLTHHCHVLAKQEHP